MPSALFIAVQAVFLMAAAASYSSQTAPLRPGEEVRLVPGGTAATADGGVCVTFMAVAEDSRCPKGARCVWAGNARVRLQLRERDEEREVALNTTLDPRRVATAAGELVLVALDPYPEAGKQIEPDDYRLTLRLQRQVN
jgi:hypothetical protein